MFCRRQIDSSSSVHSCQHNYARDKNYRILSIHFVCRSSNTACLRLHVRRLSHLSQIITKIIFTVYAGEFTTLRNLQSLWNHLQATASKTYPFAYGRYILYRDARLFLAFFEFPSFE